MKKVILQSLILIIVFLSVFFGSVENIFAVDNILGVPDQDLMTWNVNQDTLPYVVVTLIEILLEFAGTIAIFSLIYHAVKMQLSSGITGDASWVDKAKKGMIASLIGFIIAILWWFIVTRAVDLLSSIS